MRTDPPRSGRPSSRACKRSSQASPPRFTTTWRGGMASFSAGLFVGGDTLPFLQDNLDLERWFRKPKGHERRIHGHRHAGVRIVQEGPTLLLALDAHGTHPEPFTAHDLEPYQDASAPTCQVEAIHRRRITRKARSKKNEGSCLQHWNAGT